MIRILLLMLFMMHVHASNTVSSKTNKLSNNINYPRYLSFKQFSSVLKFERYEHFEQPQEVGTLTGSERWESENLKYWNGDSELENYKTRIKPPSSLSSSKLKSDENRAQQLYPFLLCHLDKTSTSGTQRYNHIKEEISKENNSNLNFHVNELPVYNFNFNIHENQKQRAEQEKEIEKDEETIYGACFYGSMSNIMARNVKGDNIFATPILPDLKIRRGASMKNKKNGNNNQNTKAISVRLSPGVATSDDKILELAYSFVDSFDSHPKDLSESICSDNTQLTSSTISVSSTDTSTFSYSLEHNKDEDKVIRDACLLYFIEYLSKQPQVLSVERVNKTKQLNDVASWIIQGYTEENNRPWFDIGITGEGEIVQLLDSGIDESHCYLKDASGKVPLTTDYDLTGGKIDLTKRKIIQYVAINNFNGDREDRTSHGTHIAATITGKRSDDGVTETDGMVDGVSPGVKLAFFDAHNSQDPNNKEFEIPSDIPYLFYFGRQVGARIHSASWGVHINGEYSERVRLIDSYFYNDEDDEFIMFAAAGNDGLDGSSTVLDPSLAKNVISVGASHSHGDDLSNNMLGMDYIAAFSGQGPTDDGRIKPDIVAPGHSILSAAANTGECDPSVRPKYDPDSKEHDGVMFMSGTSMSCPIAVGAGALVRQYFREVYDLPMDISGTLLKAVLINGGEALVGRSKSVYETEFDISTQYDEFQGFGRVNLMNSLKHPDIDSPDLHVEDARVLQQGQTHEYEFEMCDSREFRVTIVWKDPPNDSAGCLRCLVNDLDLEVELNEHIYYPNGRTEKDDRNNVERVIIDSSDISNSEQTVYVRVKAFNLGYGQVQKYSLASTGCINNDNFVSPTLSPTNSCGENEFEYVLEIFTDRQPEDTSWILEYQGSGGVINATIAGEYDKKLNSYIKKGCARYDCFLFVIRDSNFDGLCCSRGMGSYRITTGDEILVEGDSFRDRQEIEKFCYFGSSTEDPTASPTVVCNDDEFKYHIDIKTDLHPDETRWELRKPRIDGVDPGTYTESYREYQHEGCLDVDSCVSFSAYGYHSFLFHKDEFTIMVDDYVVAERYDIDLFVTKEFCYSNETNSSYGIRTATVGRNYGDKFDDKHPTWQYGNVREIEMWSSYNVDFIGITYESGQSFEHGKKKGSRDTITLGEDQYITKVSGESEWRISRLIFETNDGKIFGPYGYGSAYHSGNYSFEFDFGENALVYIFGREDYATILQLGFAHASLPRTITDSPTSQPTSLPCDDDQFRYQIIIRTGGNPEGTWWELYPIDSIIDSVPYLTYDKQFETYSHTGCTSYDNCYELRVYDESHDGLCCYFGSGSYKLGVGNDVLVQGNNFDDSYRVGNHAYKIYAFNMHEFCYDHQPSESPPSFAVQPTSKPSKMTCSNDEFEYRIRVRTHFLPEIIGWTFKYLDGSLIESVEIDEYVVQYFEHNHRGCLSLDNCFEFYIESIYALCCEYGIGGYTVFANDFVMAEGGEFYKNETKTFCYGPSYSQSPSGTTGYPTPVPTTTSNPSLISSFPSYILSSKPSISSNPSSKPSSSPIILVCDENEFKYKVIVTTDYTPWTTSWELNFINGTIIDSVEEGEYAERNTEHVYKGCLDLDSCVIFTIFDLWGNGIASPGGYTVFANDDVMAEGGEFGDEETTEFCYGPSYSLSPTSSSNPSFIPTTSLQPSSGPLVCDENEFKYVVVVTTDRYPEETSWKLNYNNGTIIDSQDKGYYTDRDTEHVHNGCMELDSCVIFTISDYWGDGICCSSGNGGYTIFANDDVMAEGGEFDYYYETKTFCYGPSVTDYPSSGPLVCDENEFKYVVVVTTDKVPHDTSWELKYINGTIIDSVEYGEYTDWVSEHVHEGCIDLDSCVIFTIFDYLSNGICCRFGNGGYTVFANNDVMAEGGRFNDTETKTFCYGPSYSISPSSSPTVHCDENEFTYVVVVTTDNYPYQTSWELNYINGTIIDRVEQGEYTDYFYEHVHKSCLDIDSCVIFTIFDKRGNGISSPGGYTVIADDVVILEGGEFGDEETKEFCYGPSYSFSPSFANQRCENGSNNHNNCGYWASIGLCENDDSDHQNWMLKNCAKACSNCCMDYDDSCDEHVNDNHCTDPSPYSDFRYGITWQEWMQASCRISCDACGIDFTTSPTPPVVCSDGEFQYEIVHTFESNDEDYYYWTLFYKYPDLIDGIELPEGYDALDYYVQSIIDSFLFVQLPQNGEKRYYGCAKYSCFDLRVIYAYLKVYDMDTGTLIAQNIERIEDLRFCHYKPQPTISGLKEAIFTITLSFSTTSLHQEEIVSSVSHRSIQKILFHFNQINEYNPFIAVEYSFCEEFKCDVSFRVCNNESCNNDEELEPDFLAFIANTLKEAKANELLLLTLKQTGHHMTVGIFDIIENDIKIEFDFDYEAWPTTSPTTRPSSKPQQNCNQNLFTKIAAIMQIFIQGITDTFTNVTSSISDELFGVDTVNSTDLILCKDKMFQLQIEIQTDSTPNKTSWELLYDNGTIIESVGQNTYSECNTTLKYNYCLDTSCFVFNLWDSFSFQGSYNITVGNTTLAQQDTFMWWKDTKRFCYPLCDDDDGMFALQLDLVTDPWPHETSWQLSFENGTLIDSVEEGYYTGLNTSYTHRYCLNDGCYSITFQDYIGDGMCCSYGEGSYMIKINDEEILLIKEGGKFEESETTTFCYPFDDVSCKGCEGEKRSLFEKITEILLKR